MNTIPASESAVELKPLTLWLVDDNADYRRLLTDMFLQSEAMFGIYCERQFDSAEAMLEALRVEPKPDVILSDVQMPGMSGVDSIVPVKRLAPQVPVILLTTFYDSDAALRAHRDGAAAFLLKRYPFEQIAAFVRNPRVARRLFGTEAPTNATPLAQAAGSEHRRRNPHQRWHWWEAGRTLLRVFLRSSPPGLLAQIVTHLRVRLISSVCITARADVETEVAKNNETKTKKYETEIHISTGGRHCGAGGNDQSRCGGRHHGLESNHRDRHQNRRAQQ